MNFLVIPLLLTVPLVSQHIVVFQVDQIEANHNNPNKVVWVWHQNEIEYYPFIVLDYPEMEWISGFWVQYFYDVKGSVIYRIESTTFIDEWYSWLFPFK